MSQIYNKTFRLREHFFQLFSASLSSVNQPPNGPPTCYGTLNKTTPIATMPYPRPRSPLCASAKPWRHLTALRRPTWARCRAATIWSLMRTPPIPEVRHSLTSPMCPPWLWLQEYESQRYMWLRTLYLRYWINCVRVYISHTINEKKKYTVIEYTFNKISLYISRNIWQLMKSTHRVLLISM